MEGQYVEVAKRGTIHLPFDDLVINMYGKLDRQWQVYLNNKLAEPGEVYTAKNMIDWKGDKNLEQVPQIKRLQNCHKLKKQPGEDTVNYKTRVTKYREIAGYDALSEEQSKVLYVVLTSGDEKFKDECLKQVTNRLDLLT